ncbi:MAG: Integral membrane sensor signal transduction histidine kinase [Candidatus Woesebacteria bacterium GW2011_GWA1_39_21]|uniref:histidine kinase n=1 Tax=Candidatus Woesebacteria bacterium GW2011_GWA1_39_21 TaxID=1618550 RepID=A0A0G0RAV2_9BACT|nr:MAG: Integral membrane sensor signal transduction histidine kinase [Candidatus Woesebacteria bacterium GW2011_GWA1_39_21]
MNTKSIRFRLTVWYALIFSVAMAVVFLAFYLLTQQSLLSHTDAAIATHNEKIVEIISQEDTTMNQSFINETQIFAQQFSEMPGMLLIIGDPYGKILYRSQNLGANESAVTDLLEKSANIIRPTFVNRNIGATPLRFGVFPAESDGQLQAIVLMGQPMDVIQKSLNTLTLTLIFVYLGLLVLTVSGGFLLARKALSPIAQVSKQLKKISAENLKERVPEPETGDEIEELSQTFNGLLDHLNEAFVRERQFIGDVAHELKTPVATLKGGIEVTISKIRTNEEYKKAFDETLIDVNRLSSTIKNILDLAWIGAENANLDDKHFDLSGALIELQEIATKLGSQKHLILKGEIEPDIVVGGAEDKLSRAVLNIIDNAIKYTPSGGSVVMSLRKKKGNAVIEVKDTGIGIPEKESEHIFERFYRGSKAAKTLGSGLGLAIAQGIIQAHRGNIEIKSKAGKGTSVTITLPLLRKSFISS